MSVSASLSALRRDTAEPFYQQIKDTIRSKIDSGRWRPGDRTPSENQLVRDFGVSRMTVNRALRELAQEGRLQRVHGVGTFVAKPAQQASLVELADIAEEVRAQGKTHRVQIAFLDSVTPAGEVAQLMELAAEQRVFHIRLVHYQDAEPIQFEDRYVNPALDPGFLDVDFQRITPTQHLLALFQPDELEHVVQAVMPSQQVRRALAMAQGEPCLRLRRRTWKDSQVVTVVSLYYPGTRYDLAARYAADRYPQPQT